MTTPLAPSSSTANSRPDTRHPAYAAMAKRWNLVRDVRGGTEVIRQKKSTYLPKFLGEEEEDWNARVGMTFMYDALAQTISAIVGLAFRRDPTLGDDVDPRIRDLWENVDNAGTHGAVFAEHVLDKALQDGHCAILADMPDLGYRPTEAEAEELGVRPYAVLVPADRIINWRVESANGRRMLTLFVIEEQVEQPAGDFGLVKVDRWRVFRQEWADLLRDPVTGAILLAREPFVAWEVWERIGNAPARVTTSGVLDGPTTIPVRIVYGGEDVDILESKPPLLGLAYSNIEHTQVKSDRRYSEHKTALAIPFFVNRAGAGTPNDTIVLSPSRGIDIGAGGTAGYMEPSGNALAALKSDLDDIEKRMASQGLSILQRDSASAETATAFAMQRSREESKLSRAVRSLADALEGTFGHFAEYLRRDAEAGGSVDLNRDFTRVGLTQTEIEVLSRLEERGQLTLEILLDALIKGGVLPDSTSAADLANEIRNERALGEPGGTNGEDPTAAALALVAGAGAPTGGNAPPVPPPPPPPAA
jgi:hypothetical protein